MRINGLDTYFSDKGSGDVVLLLHGWGGSSISFAGAENEFSQQYRTIIPDFWGFGKSEAPKQVWGVENYALAIIALMNELKVENFHIIGHSFGGRVGIYIASNYPAAVKSLILTDSAGVRPKLGFKAKKSIKEYKQTKLKVERGEMPKECLDKFGSQDYRALDVNMRATFVRVVNEDLSDRAVKITCPTLLIWGSHDKDTPLYMGRKLRKLIKKSRLKVLNGGHYAYIDQAQEFYKLCFKFWEEVW